MPFRLRQPKHNIQYTIHFNSSMKQSRQKKVSKYDSREYVMTISTILLMNLLCCSARGLRIPSITLPSIDRSLHYSSQKYFSNIAVDWRLRGGDNDADKYYAQNELPNRTPNENTNENWDNDYDFFDDENQDDFNSDIDLDNFESANSPDISVIRQQQQQQQQQQQGQYQYDQRQYQNTQQHLNTQNSDTNPAEVKGGGGFSSRLMKIQEGRGFEIDPIDGGTGGGTASMPTEIFNLVKSIVGAGVLGLPAGIAAFGGTSVALTPAIILMSIAGILSAYCFSLIGRICAYTGATSYRQAWERSVSPKTAWIPATACVLVTSCSVLAYSMILSVTLPSLAKSFGGLIISRTQALLGVTMFALLPLCLMKSLKALGPFSLVGILGMIYTCIAMAIRWHDGSYGVTGAFVDDVPLDLAPRFGPPEDVLDLLTPNLFLLVSMLSTAFMAHYNAPKFYLELRNNTLLRFNTVVAVSFGISLLLFVAVASFGFATFGKACAGLVLNNYSTHDQLMSLSRIAVAVSLLFSYPLAFVGVRDGILDLFQLQKRPDSLLNTLTIVLLSIITGLAYRLTDLRKLLALNGATWGSAVIYLLPTYMFRQCAKEGNSNAVHQKLSKEIPMATLTGFVGLVMGIIGTAMALDS